MITIRQIPKDQVHRLGDLDVSESGDMVYKWTEGHVEATHQEWHRPRWDAAAIRQHSEMVTNALARGGVMLGALDGELLVGFAALRYKLTDDMAQLVGLWVSRDYRRHKVAAGLVQEIVRLAKENGARALYVSATPSRSAVGFYQSQGFRPTLQVNQELYELEPEDIHMVKEL
jgi:ribosomal protein S18 acetylase RimI-like enzyme